MKPKNLKFPFSWEERAPLLADEVLYVPKYYHDHNVWPKDGLRAIFSGFSRIAIEYCSGNGAWVIEKAQKTPNCLWIAVEKRFDRVRRIWSKKHNFSLNNLLVVCGDAMTFTKYYLESEEVDEIFINFPDPWPKEKHAKNRLLQTQFIEQMARVAKKEALAMLVTDDADYSQQMITEMLRGELWKGTLPLPYYVTSWDDYGSSFFETLWKGQGKDIRYMQFIR